MFFFIWTARMSDWRHRIVAAVRQIDL